MIFLDIHPAAPTSVIKQQNNAKQRTKRMAKNTSQKKVTSSDDFSWQVKWMNDYNSLHTDFKELTAKLARSEEKIRQLEMKGKVQTSENATQTEFLSVDASTQTEFLSVQASTQTEFLSAQVSTQTEFLSVEASTQTEFVQNAMDINVSVDYVRNIHAYAKVDASSSNIQKFKYNCHDCGLATNKKSVNMYVCGI